MDRKLVVSLVALYLGASLLGLGLAYAGGLFARQPATSPSSPYAITLVETMNPWNSTAPSQPSFYVLSSTGLTSAASITLPVHRMIQLTIVSYDTPTPGSTDDQGRVMGTVAGNVYMMNGTTATMGNMQWGQNVTSITGGALAHTFTIAPLGINIPVVGGSTVVAYLSFDKTGTFTYICLTPCGLGPMGMMGAMSRMGWMQGQVTIQ